MNKRRAFTLVELLVVVAIIGILSSLVTVGVMAAMQAAKRARIAMEMNQITLALESYKNKFGEYPPDLWDKAAVVRHVKKRWPRFTLPGSGDDQYWAFMRAINNLYLGTTDKTGNIMDNTSDPSDHTTIMRQASYIGALPLWLGGCPNPDGKFNGFSADPEAPFGRIVSSAINNGLNDDDTNIGKAVPASPSTPDRDSVFYEMIVGKNIAYVTTTDNITFPVLVNVLRSDLFVPYVYFRGSSSGRKTAYTYNTVISGTTTYISKNYSFTSVFSGKPWVELGDISAYARSGDPSSNAPLLVWQEPERFQLIHPGLDGVFGSGTTHSPSVNLNLSTGTDTNKFDASYFRSIDTNIGTNDIGQKDFDNITNFSDYQQIKSILP